MLQELITSKTRIQLLFMFFLNKENITYLRELAHVLNESTNSIRQELTKLEDLQLLVSFKLGNKKFYRANVTHTFFPDIRNMLLKEIGFDSIKSLLYRDVLGLSEIFVIGSYAQGINSNIIDLVLIGQQLDNNQISNVIREIELKVKKKIRFLILRNNEFNKFFGHSKMFKI
ncbi:hypothetical protein AQPE_0338 [Aquipluma nitroreducens]|uniref:HTH arsR-type domain-containing protein n=1 Tax=Aquipluma nitroreducens TaxID=2010828 RepID=A0A5K7S3Q4_9BACT|nr:winged helix-turn-helix domain-containing protein [Aquipluma nitroreducens]BBE16201.1 hypothetical protein AQPE_0338 [Aquipluma nitroreducens]